jgi:hypothetical protein
MLYDSKPLRSYRQVQRCTNSEEIETEIVGSRNFLGAVCRMDNNMLKAIVIVCSVV